MCRRGHASDRRRRPSDRLRTGGHGPSGRAPARLRWRRRGHLAPAATGLARRLHAGGLGCPRRRSVVGPSRVAGPFRLRGRPGLVPDRAGPNASSPRGPVVRRNTCPRVLHPTSRTRADRQPRLGLRRMGRIPGRGPRQHATGPSDAPVRTAVGGVRGLTTPDDVPDRHTAAGDAAFRGQYAVLPRRRLPSDGAGLCRGPSCSVAPGAGAHPGDFWRGRCARR